MTTIQILQFVLSISILVILHELGHFIPAKLFKMKVEKFYLFFDPWFSVLKKKIGETEYGIGWLPLGGYVKIAGMVDESMDKEQLSKPAEPWEFRSKPAWQRLIVMLGGVTVNFFLAWLIFSGLSFFKGEIAFESEKNMNIHYAEAAKKMGFQDGDQILKVDGKIQRDLGKLSLDVLLSDNITVLRNGKEVTFATNDEGKALAIQNDEVRSFLAPRILPIVDSISSENAKKAGLKTGDRIVNIGGKEVKYFDELPGILTTLAGKTATAVVERAGQKVELSLPISAERRIGFAPTDQLSQYMTKKNYTIGEAIGRGFTRTIESLTYQVKQFKLIFNKKVQGYKKVSGPIGIIKQMPTEVDWTLFWSFTAGFSVWLAFLNLIPIPGLDGGHVVFTLWEMITGKPVPQKVLENAQMVGVIFILGLMILIFGNDIVKWITGKF